MEIESIIKKELSLEPRTATQLVLACVRKGVNRSTVFYHLKKLREKGTIRKIEDKYELAKLEEARLWEISFLIEKMKDENRDVTKAAIKDFAALCRERRVTHDGRVLPFIRDLLETSLESKLKSSALNFLRFIALNSKKTGDARVIEQLVTFKEPLKALVLNKNAEGELRHDAAVDFDLLLDDDEASYLIELLENILLETAEKPEGESQPFQLVGFYIWQRILKRLFPSKNDDLRTWLYGLLKHENKRVRDMALQLLDELRTREFEY